MACLWHFFNNGSFSAGVSEAGFRSESVAAAYSFVSNFNFFIRASVTWLKSLAQRLMKTVKTRIIETTFFVPA